MSIIFDRRSIRQYQATPIGEDDLQYILKAAFNAPSAMNRQPWELIVITDKSLLQKMAQAHPHAPLKDAPVAVLVCGDTQKAWEEYWVCDCGAATQNMLLAATEKKLGSLWCGVYPRAERMQAIQQVLQLPAHLQPFSLVVLGHAAEKKTANDRFLPAAVHYNGL
jgi:nitroreductase